MWVDKIDITKYTPMIRQYLDIKKTVKDALLFFRLGEFYELFFEDAIIGSRELEIVLTGKDAGTDDRIPMCGIPAHSAAVYFDKLVEKGYKVAIAEQTEDPSQAKGIVKREIVNIITPGTQMNSSQLNVKENQYIAAIIDFKKEVGFAVADLTTGEIKVTKLPAKIESIFNELMTYELKEIVIQSSFAFESLLSKMKDSSIFISYYDNTSFSGKNSDIIENLKDKDLVYTVSYLLNYFDEIMKCNFLHMKKATVYEIDEYMKMDQFSRESLEIVKSQRTKNKKGSLLSVIDVTKTAMGGRLLRKWLDKPLLSIEKINERLNIVEILKSDEILLEELSENLHNIYDIERLVGKISIGNVTPKELRQLSESLKYIPLIKDTLLKYNQKNVSDYISISSDFDSLRHILDRAIVDNPPQIIKDGGIIKSGYNEELDLLRDINTNGKKWLLEYEENERLETNIKSLKVGYNKVFGYYIEVRKTNLHLIDGREDYERKQTLANCERYITPTLKEMENKILGAQEKILVLEYELFVEVRDFVKKYIYDLQIISTKLANLDVLSSFAKLATENGYFRPTFNKENITQIVDGRHPVVERNLDAITYIPNDISLDAKTNILLVTGPNMSGKSTYMRQMALTSILGQIGCFVPAKSASLPVFDQIFTRIGASDDLASGQSTFMIEMLEANNALLNATKNSLIIFDELGRGTSTYDGMALAQSILEYIHNNIGATTFFSTHYHELTKLDESLDRLRNIHVGAVEEKGEISFLHKVIEGPTSKSYGVLVAKLAGLPNSLIKRANNLLTFYETNSGNSQNTIFDFPSYDVNEASNDYCELIDTISQIEPNNLSPLEALNLIYEIKKMI